MRNPELGILSALALLTRFWDLFNPAAVVWDERHFERFAGAYYTGSYYIDVHPPFGKLLFYWTARLMHVSGSALAAMAPAPQLRLLPALCGALIIPLVYLIMRELGAHRRVAALAAVMLLVDNAMLAESRLILMDMVLLCAGMVAVLSHLISRRTRGASHWMFVGGAALAAGAALSIKWTGLSILGLIVLHTCVDHLRQKGSRRALLRELLVYMAIPMIVYVAAFAIHFALLPNTGSGASYMSMAFRSTLAGDPAYDPHAHLSLFSQMRELNQTMGAINVAWAHDTNNGASPWYTWPFALHSMGLWTHTTSNSVRWIVLFANPIVWLGAVLAALVVVGAIALRTARLDERRPALAFLAAGYVMNFIPFAFITRPMYLYHYFFALIFSVMFASLGVGDLLAWSAADDRSFTGRRSYTPVLIAACAAFIYLAPLTYGWSLSSSTAAHQLMVVERRMPSGR